MEPWIPVFVASVWPITLGVVLLVYCKHIKSILRTIDARIRKGAAVTTRWGSIGSADANVGNPPISSSDHSDASLSDNRADSDSIDVPTILRGVCLEIRLNEEVATSILGDLDNLLHGTGLIPLRRLKEGATAGLIQHPPFSLNDPRINLSWVYLQEIAMFNRLVDSIDNPTFPPLYTESRIEQALKFKDRLKKTGSELLAALAMRG